MKQFAFALVTLFISVNCYSQAVDSVQYQVRNGNDTEYVQWIIYYLNDGQIEINSTNLNDGTVQTVLCDSQYVTSYWHYQNASKDSEFEVTAYGDRLHLQGKIQSKIEDKWLDCDKAPWIQFQGLAMEHFVKSGKSVIQFVSVKADNGKLYCMKAKQRETAEISVINEKMLARRVEVRLSGWRSRLGSVSYWIDELSGHFVRFDGFSEPLLRRKLVYQRLSPAIQPDNALKLTVRME